MSFSEDYVGSKGSLNLLSISVILFLFSSYQSRKISRQSSIRDVFFQSSVSVSPHLQFVSQVNENQLEKMKELFNAMDVNGDGELSKQELFQIFTELGYVVIWNERVFVHVSA